MEWRQISNILLIPYNYLSDNEAPPLHMLFRFKDFTENIVFLTAVTFRGLTKYIAHIPSKRF